MQNKPSKRLPWAAVVLVVAILCAVTYGVASLLASRDGNRIHGAVSVPARATQPVLPLGDGLIYYDGASLHAMDAQGRQLWSYAAGSGAGFSVGSGAVATWFGSTLSLVDAVQGTVPFSGPVEGPVVEARVGSSFVAVQVGQDAEGLVQEHDSVMLIWDHGGRQVDRIALENQTVLDFGFFAGGSLFWVMSLDTEGTTPLTSISTYRPGRMLAGTVTDTSQLLYSVLFQSNKIRVVGETHIKDFEYTNSEITENRILVYGWLLAAADESQSNPLLVFVPESQSDGTADITDVRVIQGQQDQTIRLPGTARQVFSSGGGVYAFSNDRVMVCDPNSGEVRTYALPVYADTVLSLTQYRSAIVASGGAVYLVPLP